MASGQREGGGNGGWPVACACGTPWGGHAFFGTQACHRQARRANALKQRNIPHVTRRPTVRPGCRGGSARARRGSPGSPRSRRWACAGSGPCRRPRSSPGRARSRARRVPSTLTTSPRPKWPSTAVAPMASRLLPSVTSAFTAPASSVMRPAGFRWSASHCLRAATGAVWRLEQGADRFAREQARRARRARGPRRSRCARRCARRAWPRAPW